MAKPLQGGIAKLLAKGMKQAKMTFDATLIKVTAGARTPGALSAGTNPTEASFACKGFVPKRTATKIANTLIEQNDRVVAILGATIAGSQVPTSNDKITIDGETLRIMAVKTDGAKAVYTLLARE